MGCHQQDRPGWGSGLPKEDAHPGNVQAGFGCARFLGVDPAKSLPGTVPRTLAGAMAEADFVFLAAPLTGASCHLVGAAQLARSKPGQLIVNVGRGSLVDEGAIADALDAGSLGGYASDVFGCEDWALADRPAAISPRLLEQPGMLFTPHLGSAVRCVRLAIELRAADNIIDVLEGRAPRDAINEPRRIAA